MNFNFNYNPSFLQTVIDIGLWYAAVQLMAFIALPFLALALPNVPDRGHGLSKAFGLWLGGLLVWFLGSLEITRLNTAATWTVMILLSIASWRFIALKWGGINKFFRSIDSYFVINETIFGGTLLFFIILGSLHPEIFWGEKPMDFTFLNYFNRLESLPPDDPWASGQRMNYYYLGTFIYAVLHKLTGIDTAIGYNLGMATIAAFHISAAFSLGLMLTRKVWAALASSALLVLTGNLELLNIIKSGFEGKVIPGDFDLFWAATRALKSPYFAEFPLWSVLFADFHAHVIVLPLTVVLLGLAFRLAGPDEESSKSSFRAHRILFGALLGSLFGLNSWDCVTYCMLTGLLLLVRPINSEKALIRNLLLRARFLIRDGIWIGASAILVILPFLLTSAPGQGVGRGFVTVPEFNDFKQIISIIGQWLIPLLLTLTVLLWQMLSALVRKDQIKTLLRGAAFALVPLAIAIYPRVAAGINGTPWGVVLTSALLCFFAGAICFRKDADRSEILCGSMLFIAALLVSATEMFYLADRMNTIFKFYHAIWTLLSLTTAYFLFRFVQVMRASAGYRRMIQIPVAVVAGAFIALALVSGAINIWIMSTYKRHGDFQRPALNGMAYLERINPQEARVIKFLRENIKGTPTILEAHGPPYQDYARMTMNTGLPSVLSWDYHVYQRGTPNQEVERRRQDIATIYTTEDLNLANALLRKYDVQLIIVGELELRTYSHLPNGLHKFENNRDFFIPLFNTTTASVFLPAYSPIVRSNIGLLRSLRESGVIQ